MFSRKADAPFLVNVPAPSEDHPSWTRVGVIAVIGFLIGIAWPKVAGVRLGPSLPENAAATAAAPSASSAEAPSSIPSPAAPSVPAMAATPVASTAATPSPSVTVSKGTIYSCRTADGDTLKGGDCGSIPGLDNLVMPRLRKLAECADAAQVSGKVRFVARVDFPHNSLSIELGKNPSAPVPDGVLACAKEDFAGATPPSVTHDNPRYSLAYTVAFAGANPGSSATPSASPAATHLTSPESTQVVWDVALVRDAPKTGKVVARLQRGTPLQIGQGKDGWFPVKFGDGFTSEGWVYRGAIGR